MPAMECLDDIVYCIMLYSEYHPLHLFIRIFSQLPTRFLRWAFPIIRAISGFVVATTIQILLQMRMLTIVEKRLLLMSVKKKLPAMSDETDKFVSQSLDRTKHLGLEVQLWELERRIKLKLHPKLGASQKSVSTR